MSDGGGFDDVTRPMGGDHAQPGPATPGPHDPRTAGHTGIVGPAGTLGTVSDDLRAERERRQRMLVIGLASVGGLVLLIGVLAFVLTRGGDDGPSVAPASSEVSSSVVESSTTVVETSTTSVASTSTTSTTTTTTTIPIPTSIDAGGDLLVSAGQVVTLTALDVGEATPDEFVRWEQVAGDDVTAGVGALGGPTVSFTAPAGVGHVAFTLTVVDPESVGDDSAPSASDDIIVRYVEDAERAVFVDLERGDDSAAGSIDSPLRTLAAASATGDDIYVRSVGRHDTSAGPLELGPGVDLYGGYGVDWIRDPLQRVEITGAAVAIIVRGDEPRTISAIDLVASDASSGDSIGILVDGATVRLEDSRVVAGAAGPGRADAPVGSISIGVDIRDADRTEIVRSTVTGGSGGAGWSGSADGGEPAGPAAGGADASGPTAGAGGGSGRVQGGDGGDGGIIGDGDDAPGGAAGGTIGDRDGAPGRGGAGGVGGSGGAGAVSDPDVGRRASGAVGGEGEFGESGVGGGGGGGGFGLPPSVGGGGGAGGLGGQPGAGGVGGGGGGASIGLRAVRSGDVVVLESLVAAGAAGTGGAGAVGEAGASGGVGGDGAVGEEVLLQTPGDGGAGGGGGGGGAGGQGGGGAGGSSIGILTEDVDFVVIASTEVRGGPGGAGGPGGRPGATGADGAIGAGRSGGASGRGGTGVGAGDPGRGADGGASIAWLDLSVADQDVSDSSFRPGPAGPGGSGTPLGDAGPSRETG